MPYLQIGEVTPGSFFLRLNSSRLTIRSKLVLAKFEGRDEARSCPPASSSVTGVAGRRGAREHPAGQAIDDAGVILDGFVDHQARELAEHHADDEYP